MNSRHHAHSELYRAVPLQGDFRQRACMACWRLRKPILFAIMSPMRNSHADVVTPEASKYLRRLCKHWSHRFQVEYDEKHGTVDFGTSRCEMSAQAGRLQIHLSISAQDDMSEMQDVVAEHLRRVAHGEPSLVIQWTSEDQSVPRGNDDA